jgi:carboxylate-amine ligase
MDELCAIVALSQSLVVWLGDRYNAGLELPSHHAWTIRENKWRAARYGLDADIIRDEDGNLLALRRSISDIVETLEPVAERLGCLDDLLRVNDMLERGTSATRQREVFALSRNLADVVDSLVEELKTGTPKPLPNRDLAGGIPVHGSALAGEA